MVRDGEPGVPPLADVACAPGTRTSLSGRPETHRPRYVIVVARDQPDLWQHLRQSLMGLEGIDLVLDRRLDERWQWTPWREHRDRDMDRRRLTDTETRLSHYSLLSMHHAASDPVKSKA